MGTQTEIAWCDSTFNPWIGCTKISPGCDHCYAERDMDTRRHVAKWGSGNPRKRTSPAYWKQPLRWNQQDFYQCLCCGWRGAGSDEAETCCETPSLHLSRRRVFCASLADVFDNEVSEEWRADLFHLIESTPNLDWLLLTKRIGKAAGMIAETMATLRTSYWLPENAKPWPWPNAWLGATIVNQLEADRDVPKLLNTPAHLRFVSCEPLLERVALSRWLRAKHEYGTGIDWVIAGGESGPQARPMAAAWVRLLRDECAKFRTPFLFKQWGEWSEPGCSIPDAAPRIAVEDEAARWKIGKKAAGRSLDNRTHSEFPA